MNVNRGLLNWGLFFIILGAVPLAVQQGWVSSETAANAWRLWPLILVGLGVGLILHRTSAHFLGGVIVAATFGLLFGSLLAGGFSISNTCTSGSGGPTVSTNDSGSFDGSASVSVRLDCGKLAIGTAPGNGWNVQAQDPEGQAALIDKGSGLLTVRTPSRSGFATGITTLSGERNWTVTLPTDPQLDGEFDVNAGSATLDLNAANLGQMSGNFNAADVRVDLSGARVGTVSLTYNAGSGNVLLPSTSSVSGSIRANAASINVCTAPDLGVRVVLDGALNSTNFSSAGLVKFGDAWESANYASATNRADLTLNANAARVTLNPAGGCR